MAVCGLVESTGFPARDRRGRKSVTAQYVSVASSHWSRGICVRKRSQYGNSARLAEAPLSRGAVGRHSENGSVVRPFVRRTFLGSSCESKAQMSQGASDPLFRGRCLRRPDRQVRKKLTKAIWLILPVVICLSQRLSHACLSSHCFTVKPRMAH